MIIKILQIALKIFSIILTLLSAIIFLILAVFAITNFIVYLNSRNAPPPLTTKEYAIVLGASVHGDLLSGVLKARMETAIDLYHKKLVKNILMSGDGTDTNYSETAAMRKFALKNKIPAESLITDEKGYSTYATMLRAKEIYNINSAYIISQNFHLPRAVWIAREVGIEADGVGAGEVKEKWYYSSREFFARTKDFFQIIFKVPPIDERNFIF